MTPKERARDLCEKFEGILGRSIPTGDDPFFPESKECAKMCVQEIMGAMDMPMSEFPDGIYIGIKGDEKLIGGKKYWQQVLLEIDKL